MVDEGVADSPPFHLIPRHVYRSTFSCHQLPSTSVIHLFPLIALRGRDRPASREIAVCGGYQIPSTDRFRISTTLSQNTRRGGVGVDRPSLGTGCVFSLGTGCGVNHRSPVQFVSVLSVRFKPRLVENWTAGRWGGTPRTECSSRRIHPSHSVRSPVNSPTLAKPSAWLNLESTTVRRYPRSSACTTTSGGRSSLWTR